MSALLQAPKSSSLLRLCIRLYLSSRERCYVDYLKGAKAIFRNWYTEQIFKTDDLESIHLSCGIVCMCGRSWSDSGNRIIKSCSGCNTHHWGIDYELSELVSITQVPLPILTSLFALELEYGYQTSTAQLLLPLSST